MPPRQETDGGNGQIRLTTAVY